MRNDAHKLEYATPPRRRLVWRDWCMLAGLSAMVIVLVFMMLGAI
jgi:hypothetical protein